MVVNPALSLLLEYKEQNRKINFQYTLYLLNTLCVVAFQFFFHSETFELVYAIAGALLFSAFIVFDTHMLMHKLSPEEYILASINLYLDMINLFIEILRILNSMKKSN